MIEIQQVNHQFGGIPVLHDLTLRLAERRIGIIGSNGSGKSTFARLLNGLQIPTQGRVLVDGLETSKHGRAVRQKVGFVFQNPDNQIVMPIVEEDIAFGLQNLKLPKAEMSKRVTESLARYGLEDLSQHRTHTLSGGQKQLIAICGVLAMKPSYIVMDEPTTLLDLRNKRRVAAAIADLDETVLIVTHDLDLLMGFDRVIAFESGRVLIDDTPSTAIARYIEALA